MKNKDTTKLPACFIDSSVFLEFLLEQQYGRECMSFFAKAGYKYRLVTTPLVLGEVVKGLNKVEDMHTKEKETLLLMETLKERNVGILPVTFASIANIDAIKVEGQYMGPSDTIIFSTAISERCDLFVSLDRHFSEGLGKRFDIQVRRPYEC